MNTEENILVQIAKFSSIFPNYDLTKPTIRVYVNALMDLDPKELEIACDNLIGKVIYFPKPAEIRNEVFLIRHIISGHPDPYTAWEQICSDLARGAGNTIVRAEPKAHPLAIKAARAIGGYVSLAQSNNPTADRARFIEAYKAIGSRAEEEEKMLPAVRDHIKVLSDAMSSKRLLEGSREEAPRE